MKNRISLHPGRVQLIPVEGQPGFYDLVRADEPEEEGTPINKATLLTDETAALYNLGEDATVNAVLALMPDVVLASKPSTFERLLTGRMI